MIAYRLCWEKSICCNGFSPYINDELVGWMGSGGYFIRFKRPGIIPRPFVLSLISYLGLKKRNKLTNLLKSQTMSNDSKKISNIYIVKTLQQTIILVCNHNRKEQDQTKNCELFGQQEVK